MPPKVRKQHAPEDICIHCKRRKKQPSWPYCSTCREMLIAEGVIKSKAGVPLAVRYKQYCELANKGLKQLEIARELGLDRSYVSNLVKKCRDQGWPIPARPHSTNKIVVHGGGMQGIRGCGCEICVAKRTAYKKNWRKKYEERLRSGQLPVTIRTSHGEGSRGVKFCKCELCVQRRRDYKKEWEADVKARGFRRERKRNASVAQG